MKSSYNNEYYDIAKKARNIAKEIGRPIIRETYYTDEIIGSEYKYDGLVISYYNGDRVGDVCIKLNNTKLLYYSFDTGELTYTAGSWTELIELIHDQIPDVLNEKRLAEEYKKSKINDLKNLEDSCAYYIKCNDDKKEILGIIDSNLSDYGIYISKQAHSSVIRNLCTGDDNYITTWFYHVNYHGDEVLMFNSSPLNVFPNLEHYAQNNYTPGEWTNIFKRIIAQAIDKDKILEKQKIENDVESIMRKLRRN